MLDSILRKETLFYIPFSIDVLLCCIQFPLFVMKGPIWFANVLEGNEMNDNQKKKDDDAKDTQKLTKVPYLFLRLYDVFILCYVGYCLLMFYGCYTILIYKNELLPIFGCIQLTIIIMKLILMTRWKVDSSNAADADDVVKTNKQLQEKKDNSLWYFNLPTYGGYVVLMILEKLKN